MIEFIIIFVVVYGAVWIARSSINKRTWNTVAAKLPNGKPENLLALNVPTNDMVVVKNKLVSCLSNSNYTLVDTIGNPVILEDKKASVNPLNTMYFYPVYLSMDPSGSARVEVGIADKSSFLGNRQDRMKKLQKIFDFLSQSLK